MLKMKEGTKILILGVLLILALMGQFRVGVLD